MLIKFNKLFTVKGNVATAKVPLLIPNLLWCRRGTRLRDVQIGLVDLVALKGKEVQVRRVNGTLILENCFPSLLTETS